MQWSFGTRLAWVAAFLAGATAVDLVFHGRRATRPRACFVVLVCATCGAGFGFACDAATSTISPAYFAIGKRLGWDPGLTWRACWLGARAGANAGIVLGLVWVYAARGRMRASETRRALWSSTTAALAGSVTLGIAVAELLPAAWLEMLRDDLTRDQRRRLVIAWACHVGAYAGGFAGAGRAACRLRTVRDPGTP